MLLRNTDPKHQFKPGRLLQLRGSPERQAVGEEKNESIGHETEFSGWQGSRDEADWRWGATVDLHKKAASKAGGPAKYEVSVLVMCKTSGTSHESGQRDAPPMLTANGVQVRNNPKDNASETR